MMSNSVVDSMCHGESLLLSVCEKGTIPYEIYERSMTGNVEQ